MVSPKTKIRKSFPRLKPTDFKVHSPPDPDYNCIGFAADETAPQLWWPHGKVYWPAGLPADESPQNFVDAFRTLGYERCNSFDLEEGFEKVAIFVRKDDGRTKHMARQLGDGRWISKLGPSWDIIHKTLFGLAGKDYGEPKLALRRPRKP